MVNPFENHVQPGDHAAPKDGDHTPNSGGIQRESLALMQQALLAGKRDRAPLPTHIDTGNHAELFASTEKAAPVTYRDYLMESAARHFKNDPEKLQDFQKDMATFEGRMGKDSIVDVQRTYAEVQRLLDTPSKIVKEAEKVSIAADIMHRAAFSTQSNQGMSEDCAAAAVENRLFTRSPAEAAKLMTDTVLTGHFTDTRGSVVTVSHATIAHPGAQVTADAKAKGVEPRSRGDQIMQAIIRNEDYAQLNAGDDPKMANNGLKYEIGNATLSNPTGEYVRDYSKMPPQDVSDSNTGMRSDLNSVYAGLSTKEQFPDFEIGDPSATGPNVEAFKNKLQSMQGRYPLAIIINPNEEPFATEPGTRGLSDINHAITVEGYDPKTGLVSYRNSNFGSREQTISADKLFDSMRANLGDSVVSGVADALKDHRADIEQHPERIGPVIYDFLNRAEFGQRLDVLKSLEAASGMKLERYLSRAQERELGIAPTFLESIFGR
jgi:hypothetical protein